MRDKYKRDELGNLICTQEIDSLDLSGFNGTIPEVLAKVTRSLKDFLRYQDEEIPISYYHGRKAFATKKVKFFSIWLSSEGDYSSNSEHNYYRVVLKGSRIVDPESDEYKSYAEEERQSKERRDQYERAQYEALKKRFGG